MSRSSVERRAVDRVASGTSGRTRTRLSSQLDDPIDEIGDRPIEKPVRERRTRDTASTASSRTYERVRQHSLSSNMRTDAKVRRERTERSETSSRASIRKREARTPSPKAEAGRAEAQEPHCMILRVGQVADIRFLSDNHSCASRRFTLCRVHQQE